MIGNIIIVIVALMVAIPHLWVTFSFRKEQPAVSIYCLFIALVILGVAAKIVGV